MGLKEEAFRRVGEGGGGTVGEGGLLVIGIAVIIIVGSEQSN